MRWHLDPCTGNTITGWIYDELSPSNDIVVLAVNGAALVGKASATDYRESLAGTSHKVNSGFSITLAQGTDPASTVLLACDYARYSDTFVIYSPDQSAIGTRAMPYQRFEDLSRKTSASRSNEKLRALKLPRLAKKSLLDIGCNEGFFCQIAAKSGARRVLGIDQSSLSIEKAKLRLAALPELSSMPIEFRCASWWDIPEERFDVILFLSAVHYEPEQKRLFDFLATRLEPDGLLVLECGIAPGESEHWVLVNRGKDHYRFPTEKLLYSQLLSSYAVLKKGQSVTQQGDPLPRFVFHCHVKRPTVCIIRGRSGSGKSWLSRTLWQKGIVTFSSDTFFSRYQTTYKDYAPATPLYAMIANELDTRHGLNHVIEKLRELGAIEEFCRDFTDCLPFEDELLFVEGEVFRHEDVYTAFCAELKKRGAIPWKMDRS